LRCFIIDHFDQFGGVYGFVSGHLAAPFGHGVSIQIFGNWAVIQEGFDKIKKKSLNNQMVIRHDPR
jgi:hypothetical protein